MTVSLGRIPLAGESFVAGRLAVEVLAAEPTRVLQVRVSPAPEGEPTGNDDEAANRVGAK